ncbi:MAG: cell division protein ZapB [Treponema sp.]|jgi:chromosome segregation ATPase|nr:cell division protein ZapB [Treponema sp.]
MSTLDNVKLLEARIEKAVEIIKQLTEENKKLKDKTVSLQEKIDDLEFTVLTYKEDQQHIESGIQSVMDRLNQLDETLGQTVVPHKAEQQSPTPNYGNNRDMFHGGGNYQGNNGYKPDQPL